MKVWKVSDSNQPNFSKDFKVTKRWEGSCADVIKNSNKFYHIEIQVSNDGKARIFTTYGRVGKVQSKDFRYYLSEEACLSDYYRLIKKKRDRKKDPYREIDLAITSVGSERAKEIKKPMNIAIESESKSNLHKKVQNLVSSWYGSTGNFITMNLKCPLGQLTKEQIDKGRLILNDCRIRINSNNETSINIYDQLTSQFYSLIPHILPYKINPDTLRLNLLDRIMKKHDMLDTFLDAKNVESILKTNCIDKQYEQLNADISWLDPSTNICRWISRMVNETRASNHNRLGNIKIHNIYKLNRKNEDILFNNRIREISEKRKLSSWTWPTMINKLGPDRPDINNELDMYKRANVIPLFHGTRNENMIGITSHGLLIRPSGAVFTGAAFGSGIYFGMSSKAINYSSSRGSYWAKGNNRIGYLYLADVCLGDPKVLKSSGYYTAENIKPYHSVWAKSGGYLINDEFVLYHQSGPKQQHKLQYIIEIETQVR